jgi:hypothetical protein
MKSLEQRIREWEEAERAQNEKPRYYAGLGRFARFTDYKIIEEGKDRRFTLVPTENANVEWYRPFDFEPSFLCDYLEVRNALRYGKNSEAQFILDHMSSFLLGDLPSSERDKAARIKDASRQKRAIAEKQIAFIERLPVLTPELESEFRSRLEHDKPVILDFCRRYGDIESGDSSESALREAYKADSYRFQSLPKTQRVEFEPWIRKHSDLRVGALEYWYEPNQILTLFKAWEQYRISSSASAPMDQFINVINGFTVQAGLRLAFVNAHWGIDFEAGRLKDVLGIMLINIITAGKDQIRICALDDCRRPFITRDPRANYCCHAHSQRGRVRKHREKQNGKGRKLNP